MPLDDLVAKHFEIVYQSHAKAILDSDFPEALQELFTVLERLEIPVDRLIRGGGGESETTQGLRRLLASHGWKKHNFTIQKLIDGVERESISHEIDHVRELPNGKIAMEIEWNNKDPFFDRDLENFKRLHAEAAISVGIILTRGRSLQNGMRDLVLRFATECGIESFADLDPYGIAPTRRQQTQVADRMKSGKSFAEAWTNVFCSDKYGEATTHWRKLEDRVHRGVGNPCPLLLIGIPSSVIVFPAAEEIDAPVSG